MFQLLAMTLLVDEETHGFQMPSDSELDKFDIDHAHSCTAGWHCSYNVPRLRWSHIHLKSSWGSMGSTRFGKPVQKIFSSPKPAKKFTGSFDGIKK